jgi:hypothetical protein
MIARIALPEAVIEELVARTIDGDEWARADLWLALTPVIKSIAGRWRVTGPLHDCVDAQRDVLVAVMARLEARGFHRLRMFHEKLRARNGTAAAWLRILVYHAALRHAEGHAERLGAGTKDDPRRWVDVEPRGDGLEEEMPPESVRVYDVVEAHEIFDYAEGNLPPRQVEALRLWAVDKTPGEIAAAMRLPGAPEANKLVRAAKGRLRTRFAGWAGDEEEKEGDDFSEPS